MQRELIHRHNKYVSDLHMINLRQVFLEGHKTILSLTCFSRAALLESPILSYQEIKLEHRELLHIYAHVTVTII